MLNREVLFLLLIALLSTALGLQCYTGLDSDYQVTFVLVLVPVPVLVPVLVQC